MDEQVKTVLIAGVGLSPAVLTNTVWALAHEKEPVIPDEVVAITTLTGSKCIREQLLETGAWWKMHRLLEAEGLPVKDKLAFGASETIKVIGDGRVDYDDMATPEQNDAAADFILKKIRQYTEDPGTRVIVSIAGGRKSMSALLMSCMSLLGREQDRVCHVLVNEPYEQRLDPPFLFPEKGVVHEFRGKKYSSLDGKPLLSDIPFVRVRGWYEKEFKSVPPSYMQLVNKVQGIAPRAANYPKVLLDATMGTLRIGKTPVSLSDSEFALTYLILKRIVGERRLRSWPELEEDMGKLLKKKVPTDVDWFYSFIEAGEPDSDDFRKWAAAVRKKLKKAFVDAGLADMLIPSMKNLAGDIYPANKVKIIDVI